jgi:cold shock CspA family protein
MPWLEGVYEKITEPPQRKPRLRRVRAPTSAQLTQLADTIAHRVCRRLVRRGWLEGEYGSVFLSDSSAGDDGMDGHPSKSADACPRPAHRIPPKGVGARAPAGRPRRRALRAPRARAQVLYMLVSVAHGCTSGPERTVLRLPFWSHNIRSRFATRPWLGLQSTALMILCLCVSHGAVAERVGTVKWYDPKKGRGFITPNGSGPDFYVHSGMLIPGAGVLCEGQQVAYSIGGSTGQLTIRLLGAACNPEPAQSAPATAQPAPPPPTPTTSESAPQNDTPAAETEAGDAADDSVDDTASEDGGSTDGDAADGSDAADKQAGEEEVADDEASDDESGGEETGAEESGSEESGDEDTGSEESGDEDTGSEESGGEESGEEDVGDEEAGDGEMSSGRL